MTKIPPLRVWDTVKHVIHLIRLLSKLKKKRLHKTIICEIILRSGKNYFEKSWFHSCIYTGVNNV